MIRRVLLGVGLAAAIVPVLNAHHGIGSFDLSKQVTFTGKLTKIELVNPHSWLYFEVTEPGGKVSKHRCEMRSAHTLRRSGWTKDLFPIGSTITIEVFDAGGRRVRSLLRDELAAGRHVLELDTRRDPLPSGVYLVRLTTRAGVFVQRIVRVEGD